MSKAKHFFDAMRKLNIKSAEYDRQTNYMQDMNNWLCVHATKYMPKRNSDDKLNIQTTAMAEGYTFPRQTVHFYVKSYCRWWFYWCG